jgi:hypothetical protein
MSSSGSALSKRWRMRSIALRNDGLAAGAITNIGAIDRFVALPIAAS